MSLSLHSTPDVGRSFTRIAFHSGDKEPLSIWIAKIVVIAEVELDQDGRVSTMPLNRPQQGSAWVSDEPAHKPTRAIAPRCTFCDWSRQTLCITNRAHLKVIGSIPIPA